MSTLMLFSFIVGVLGVGNYMDYYWRDMDDEIPPDAFFAVKNRRLSYFISRTFLGDTQGDIRSITPTLIREAKIRQFQILYEEFDKSIIYNIHYRVTKILCATENKLGWTTTDVVRLRSLTNCDLVVVGYNKDAVLTVIRQKIGNSMSLYPFFDRELAGYKILVNTTFQILSYGCPSELMTATYKESTHAERNYPPILVPKGFYWRDFNGDIPPDAVSAGYSMGGKVVHIGQLFHRDHRVVTVIPLSGGQYISPYGLYERPVQYEMTNVQILCSGEKEKMKWVHVNNFDFKGNSCRLVPGGAWKTECPTFIGRSFYNGATHLDNVFEHQLGIKPAYNVCLPYPSNVSREAIMLNFDVLVYDCDIK